MRHSTGDAGSGLVASSFGVLAFLAFLLLATQLLIGLHVRSTLRAVADDGARSVAHGEIESLAQARAEAAMRGELGRSGDTARFDWSASTADSISVTVTVDAPRFLLGGFTGPLVTDQASVTATVRREQLR